MTSLAGLPWARAMRLGGMQQRGEISEGVYCVRLLAVFAARAGRPLSEDEIKQMEPGEVRALAASIISRFNVLEELADAL